MKDDIIKLARQVGAGEPLSMFGRTDYVVMTRSELERFYQLAVSAEREKFVAFLRQMHDAYALASDPPRNKT